MARRHSLPAELTIYSVGPTRSLFQEWASKPPKARRGAAAGNVPLLVDSSAVQEVDAAGVQLLLSLARSLAAGKRTLQLESPSSALSSACHTLGAASLIPALPADGAPA